MEIKPGHDGSHDLPAGDRAGVALAEPADRLTPLRLCIVGLSISSSWGNGHATIYRALSGALHRRGCHVDFLERDVPWYGGDHRDLANPPGVMLHLYQQLDELDQADSPVAEAIAAADVVILGSYVPDGIEAARKVLALAQGPVCFYDIDTPVTLAAVDRGDCEYMNRDLIPWFDTYLSFTGGPTLDRLEREYASPSARAFYCCVDPEVYRPRDIETIEEKRDFDNGDEREVLDLGYLGTYSDDRQPTLQRLLLEPADRLPGRNFSVCGPQYPGLIRWPKNVQRREHLPPAEHPAFYNRQRFTLNVTRAHMLEAGFAPSVRLFEAAACGTPIISDPWRGIETLFIPDQQIFLADTADRVVELLEDLPEPQRRATGSAARAVVLREHTADVRAAQLLEILHSLV